MFPSDPQHLLGIISPRSLLPAPCPLASYSTPTLQDMEDMARPKQNFKIALEVVSERPEMASVRGMFKLAMQQAAKKGV